MLFNITINQPHRHQYYPAQIQDLTPVAKPGIGSGGRCLLPPAMAYKCTIQTQNTNAQYKQIQIHWTTLNTKGNIIGFHGQCCPPHSTPRSVVKRRSGNIRFSNTPSQSQPWPVSMTDGKRNVGPPWF